MRHANANGTPDAGTPSASPAAVSECVASRYAERVSGGYATPTPPVTGPTYTTIVTGADIKDAYPTTDSLGSLVVGFEMKDSGSDKLYRVHQPAHRSADVDRG